jgi:hypothetical protein
VEHDEEDLEDDDTEVILLVSHAPARPRFQESFAIPTRRADLQREHLQARAIAADVVKLYQSMHPSMPHHMSRPS